MLAPSLFGLDCDGLLPNDLRIVGAARSHLDDEAYRNLLDGALREFIEPDRLKPELVAKFLARVRYVPLDVTAPEQFLGAARRAASGERTERTRGLACGYSCPPPRRCSVRRSPGSRAPA